MRILLVENHAAFVLTVTAEFMADHTVVSVGSVFEALDFVRAQSFDAALVDFDLYDAKGDIFVRRVREMGTALPIVAISAHEDGNAALIGAGVYDVCAEGNFQHIADAVRSVAGRAATSAG